MYLLSHLSICVFSSIYCVLWRIRNVEIYTSLNKSCVSVWIYYAVFQRTKWTVAHLHTESKCCFGYQRTEFSVKRFIDSGNEIFSLLFMKTHKQYLHKSSHWNASPTNLVIICILGIHFNIILPSTSVSSLNFLSRFVCHMSMLSICPACLILYNTIFFSDNCWTVQSFVLQSWCFLSFPWKAKA